MRLFTRLSPIAVILSIAFASHADASTISYTFAIDAPNGYPVTHLSLYATDGTNDALSLSPVVIGPSGVFTLTQTVNFTPTAALIVGITERDKDDWWDIVFFVSDAYAAAGLGQRYDALFPSGSPNLGHNVISVTIQAAHAGDGDALAALLAHLRGPSAIAAYFDPFGSYSIIQFSTVPPPIGGDVPEPASAVLVLTGVAVLALARRARRT